MGSFSFQPSVTVPDIRSEKGQIRFIVILVQLVISGIQTVYFKGLRTLPSDTFFWVRFIRFRYKNKAVDQSN